MKYKEISKFPSVKKDVAFVVDKSLTSEEIEKFLWYDTDMDNNILSNTLKNEVVPYCKKNNLIK